MEDFVIGASRQRLLCNFVVKLPAENLSLVVDGWAHFLAAALSRRPLLGRALVALPRDVTRLDR